MAERVPVETKSRSGLLLWAAGLLFVAGCHLIWATLNRAPLLWDMAYHELTGWQFLQAWREGQLWGSLAQLSPIYPPLFYLQEALWIAVLGASPYLGVLSNLAAVGLLSWSTLRIAGRWLNSREAAAAGIVVLLFPEVAWMSREPVLDLWLAAWVALAAEFMLKSGGFQRFGWTLGFGWAVAAGVLTKWTAPLYLVFPVLWCWWHGKQRWKGLGRLVAAAALSIPLILPYYLPNLADFVARYPTTHQAGIIPWKPYPRHGEPGLNNLRGWIYYPRILANYFLQLPLLLLGVTGMVAPRRRVRMGHAGAQVQLVSFLWVWLLGGIAVLTLLSPKDPRFALPLSAPLSILLVGAWRGRFQGVAVMLGTAALGFLLASFATPLGDFKLAIGEKRPDPDFQGLQVEWVLLQTHYFRVAGPPRQEDWALGEILKEIPDSSRVGFLPDAPRFHAEGLSLEAARKGRRVEVRRLGGSQQRLGRLQQFDYLVGKSGSQGISFTTQYNAEILQRAIAAGWHAVRSWPLPDGSRAFLWRNGRINSGQ